MDKRMIFGNNANAYNNLRPKYCERVFEEIISYSKINNYSKIIEIGCGTGQATEEFLNRGYNIYAVEISELMCEFVREKFFDKSFHVENKSFEEVNIEREFVDLFVAATSFHWIDESCGYKKMWDALKNNGSIALFWNRPFVARKNDPLHMKIQEIYKRYENEGYRKGGGEKNEFDIERYKKIVDTIGKYNFDDIEFHTFKSLRMFKAKDYVELLNTYSDHHIMEEHAKVSFENEIRNAICLYGNALIVYDTVELYLARKINKH